MIVGEAAPALRLGKLSSAQAEKSGCQRLSAHGQPGHVPVTTSLLLPKSLPVRAATTLPFCKSRKIVVKILEYLLDVSNRLSKLLLDVEISSLEWRD